MDLYISNTIKNYENEPNKYWIEKLDEFINITGNEILKHGGSISHLQAIEKASAEYEKYKEKTKNELSEAEKHFIATIENTAKKLNQKKRK